jgi:hypothetical protein
MHGATIKIKNKMVAYTYFMLYLYGFYVLYSENLENVLDVCCVNNILFSDLRISF